MPTRVYLMRHGEVQNGGEKRYNGHIDVDITRKGEEQMRSLAERLVGKPAQFGNLSLNAIYSHHDHVPLDCVLTHVGILLRICS